MKSINKGKKYRPYKRMTQEMLRKSPIVFSYLCLDKLYTFYKKRDNRIYIWSSVGLTKTGRKFYFYLLSKNKDINSLLFDFDLLKMEKYYRDGHFSYSNVYEDKATQKKSKYTNLIENLNLQIRDKISYLVRKTKAHAKFFEWLDNRLAMFFFNLNLKGNK